MHVAPCNLWSAYVRYVHILHTDVLHICACANVCTHKGGRVSGHASEQIQLQHQSLHREKCHPGDPRPGQKPQPLTWGLLPTQLKQPLHVSLRAVSPHPTASSQVLEVFQATTGCLLTLHRGLPQKHLSTLAPSHRGAAGDPLTAPLRSSPRPHQASHRPTRCAVKFRGRIG